jgi:hypothetical protein
VPRAQSSSRIAQAFCERPVGSGTVGTTNVTNAAVTCANLPPTTYTIGGALSGLASGASIVLQNNGGGNLTRSANGAFTFATAITSGALYDVTVLTQPASQSCSVSNGSGTIGSANVTNVGITCQSNATAPIITITSPVSNSTYTTSSSPIEISGTASSSTAITAVTWANLSGGKGSATTTTSWSTWSISGIALQSGINVITVTAKDAAGMSGTDTLTITYSAPNNSGDDLSGMKIWEGGWFKLAITHGGEHQSVTTAHLKILSWDSTMRILRTNLYSSGSSRGSWDVTQLPLRYTSGTPLKFLFSFDYAGLYGFTGSLTGRMDDGKTLVFARLRAQGIYLSSEGDDGERKDEESETSRDNVTITGSLIFDSQIPHQIQNQDDF